MTWWEIWKERNQRIFEQKLVSALQVSVFAIDQVGCGITPLPRKRRTGPTVAFSSAVIVILISGWIPLIAFSPSPLVFLAQQW
jgi:hypothetical protein